MNYLIYDQAFITKPKSTIITSKPRIYSRKYIITPNFLISSSNFLISLLNFIYKFNKILTAYHFKKYNIITPH